MSTLKRLHRQAKSRRSSKPAFTLLELIVVLTVVGILSAIAVPTFNTVKENSAERTFQATADGIARNAAAIAAAANDGDNDVSAADIIAAAAEVGVDEDAGVLTDVLGSYTCTSTITASGTSASASAASCSTGGIGAPVSYTVGDTGPGGGVVFYVDAAGFACGAALASTCTYLEAAPATSDEQAGAFPAVNRITWAESTYDWTEVSGADGVDVGTGMQNSLDIDALSQNTAAVSAAVYANEYTNNGYSDWYLPSKGELNELYAARATVGDLRTSGNPTMYWSSTEAFTFAAWWQDMANGTQSVEARSNNLAAWVRPIRAG